MLVNQGSIGTSAERVFQVRVTLRGAPDGMEHFTPQCLMRWGKCQFYLNPEDGGHYDFWIVFGNAIGEEYATVAPENTLFIAGEPPSKKVYSRRFYNQFGHVVDTHTGSKHSQLVLSALGLCWLVGLDTGEMRFKYGYDYLSELPRPEKQNKIAVVCSDASRTAGQRARLGFLKALKEELGTRIVHYGKGFQPINDKMDAIYPYRYQLVLENSQSPHYWTEKLIDSYLGWGYPFYIGCPNLHEYFRRDSFTELSIKEPKKSACAIAKALDSAECTNEINAVERSRIQVLERYNPFARFDYWVRLFHVERSVQRVTILSAKRFSLGRKLRRMFGATGS